MDERRLAELLSQTLDPNARQQAEEELEKIKKIIGFAPGLLRVVMLNTLEMPTRQAGVIYLKNMVTQYWQDVEFTEGEPLPFNIHEQDRAMIRESIVDAVVLSPDQVRVQLAVCTYHMIKYDFPTRWTTIVDKINIYLQNPDSQMWNGALLCLYQLVKNYEYKKKEERGPLYEAMGLLLPMCHERIVALLPDPSEYAVLLQKLILKIFYALTQHHFPIELLNKEQFTAWMEVVRQITDRPVPEQTLQVDEEEKPDLPWWKVKKWALHILARLFEKYGCPSTVQKDYKEFAEWYIKTFSQGILQVLLKVLDEYRNKVYVSPRVLQQALNYVEQGVGQAMTWKLLKPHMMSVIQSVIFPLLCYSDADQELWNNDPYEYVRIKSDIYEDLVSPVTAAEGLLLSLVKKRKEMLEKTMMFLMQVLTSPTIEPVHKDGVFHMIGTIGPVLMKKKAYKSQLEPMLVQYVFPEFQSPHGFLRARSCWLLQRLETLEFSNDQNLVMALQCIEGALLREDQIPVKVEAAMVFSAYLATQDKAENMLKPKIVQIVQELLKVIKETENDDLTNVMCKIVQIYGDDLTPLAAYMCTELAETFQQVVSSEDGAEEKAITAMGLLSTIETLITCMEENETIMREIEPIVLTVVGFILTKGVMEFYEEALSLVYSLTSTRISPDLWKCFEMLYTTFKDDGFDYFTEMMPALHNYVCVDTPAFLSNEARLKAILEMSHTVLKNDCGEDYDCMAAKLLEVVVLQCDGKVQDPSFLQAILEAVVPRLMKEVKTTELKHMLLQVLIACFYLAPEPVLNAMSLYPLGENTQGLLYNFVEQFVKEAENIMGLHDRKIWVLGLCTLVQLGPARIPPLQVKLPEVMTAFQKLFVGLKKAYIAKAKDENDSSTGDDSDDDDFDLEDVLESDEDELDDDGDEYLEHLEEKVKKSVKNVPFPMTVSMLDAPEDDSSDEEDLDELDESGLTAFTTPLDKDDCEVDEYWVFKNMMLDLQSKTPELYAELTANLADNQQQVFQEVITLADQRQAARQSKIIELRGGYSFQQTTVPTSFNFGGSFGS